MSAKRPMVRCNTVFGTATVIADEISSGGQPIVRVLLDGNGEERVFLRAFVVESDTPVPLAAKKRPRKPRTKKEKPEPISDGLLVEKVPIEILPSFDPLPDDSSDYDELPELAGECTETV